MTLYPLFLKLEGKRALVVGGGEIGLHKARELVASGARVVIVSETFAGEVDGAEHIARKFTPGDARGAFIVISATGDHAVDDEVARDGREHGALVNVVDRSEISDFYSGAVVRRGPLTVVVGTSGASPALARKVRQKIEEVLPESLTMLAQKLGDARPKLLARFPEFHERARVLDQFVERAWGRDDVDVEALCESK